MTTIQAITIRGTNLIDASWWAPGATNQWAYNGAAAENSFVVGLDFSGKSIPLWRMQAGAGGASSGDADGGWNGGTFVTNLDRSKTYRFIVPVKRTTSQSGPNYWGTYGVCDLNTTNENNNPYFSALTLPTINEWYLMVGYIFPVGSTGRTNDGAGCFNASTGALVAGGTNWTFTAGSTVVHRAYQYYASAGAVSWFGTPMVHTVDGSEPPLEAVLKNTATNYAAIQTEATARANADGTLFAQYTVKIDTNGYVSGYGLASTATNATPTSSFAVRADQFYIANPAGPGVAPAMPFIVRTTATTINGVSVPVGVYVTDAFIQNGTITNAKIGNAAIDDAKVANLSASKITAGTISADRIAASSITADKIAANTITASQIAAGTITASQIAANTITASQIAAGTITADKINGTNLAVVNGSFSGALSAATGTFAGALSGATGTFRGSLNAATGSFGGSLLAGTLDISQLVGQSTQYNAAGSYTLTVPSGFTSMRLTLVGGGGGGYRAELGAGGGGGGLTIATFTGMSAGATLSLVVGAGGAAVYATSGQAPPAGAGGSTFVSGYASAGGGGGAYSMQGGAGGSGSSANGGAAATNSFGPQPAFDSGASQAVYYNPIGGAAGGNQGPGGSTGQAGGFAGGGGGGSPGGGAGGGYSGPAGNGASGKAIVEFFNPNGVIIRSEWSSLISALQRQGIAVT